MDVLAIGTSTSGTPKGPLGRQQVLPTSLFCLALIDPAREFLAQAA